MVGNVTGPEPAEVRQERISALVLERARPRISLVVTDASADPSILADLAAVRCDVQVAEPVR
ncbi:MAG TPA: hypothetical protein VF087_15010 [Solirubrobacteraceae bacterium]